MSDPIRDTVQGVSASLIAERAARMRAEAELDTLRDALTDAEETARMYVGQNKDNLDGTDAHILARMVLKAIARKS